MKGFAAYIDQMVKKLQQEEGDRRLPRERMKPEELWGNETW